MKSRWDAYRRAAEPLPDSVLSWPFRGAGLDSLGVGGKPVVEPMPACGAEEILVRVDALGLCASDGKMVRMGSRYPLFFARNFAREPARLGHEAALTVVAVGEAWQDRYHPGQRLGIQANVYVDGKRAIFGVNIPGAMTQYLALDSRVLAGDAGSYVFPVPAELSYADVALLEPWACVHAAYSPARRLEPKGGGTLWIKGRPNGANTFRCSRTLECARAVLSCVPADLAAWVRKQPVAVIEGSGYEVESLANQFTGGQGFDDIILLDPGRSLEVAQAADTLAPRGVLNLVTARPLDGPVPIDVGRLHYEHLAYVGCPGPDIAKAYGSEHHRSDLRAKGVTLIVGAGGTMGRMHTQRALEMADGPSAIIVTNRGTARLRDLERGFANLARASGRELVGVSPQAEPGRLELEVERLTGGRGCDDVVVVAPGTAAIEQALPHLALDGMLVLFAGVAAGTRVLLPMDRVALHGAQFTGTSGSTVADELRVLDAVTAGTLSPARSLAAIGGHQAMAAGIQAVSERSYPGKIVIYTQLVDLPLMALSELRVDLPAVYAELGPDESWTVTAEKALFEHFL